MRTFAIFLWAVVVPGPAAAVDCMPSIRLNGTSGGGKTLLVSADNSSSCGPCRHLELSYERCNQRNAPCNKDWYNASNALTVERTPAGLRQLRARGTVFLTGWYRVCCTNKAIACSNRSTDAWVDALNYTTWNVTISSQQTSANPPQLSVEVVAQMDPSTDLQDLYFPNLNVRLFNTSNGHRIESSANIMYPFNNVYVFGQSVALRPGLIEIRIMPNNVQCGVSGGCKPRRITHTITEPERDRPSPVSVDPAAKQTEYVVLGVLLGAALCCLVGFLSYRLVRGRRWLERAPTLSQKSPLPSSPAPAGPVSVLLLHRGGGGAGLDQLRAALRAAGIVLLDARERSVLNLMQSYPSPAELLALEVFRDARLLFVGGGADGPAASVPARAYDSVLKFVRNGRLGLDYGRVYAATLGDEAGDELAGLVEGRLFRVPADLPALIEHIVCARRPPLARLGSTESQADLLPAMVQSPVSTKPGSPKPSAV